MTFRVWYRNGSARLVSAADAAEARRAARELAERDAADLGAACRQAKDKERARELAQEWQGCTTIAKVEAL